MVQCFENVSTEKIVFVLRQWIAEQKSACPAESIGYEWHQVSFVFCKLLNYEQISPASNLFFSSSRKPIYSGNEQFECTFPNDQEVFPREVLLFVSYRDQFKEFWILGFLSCERYAHLSEFPELTLGQLQTENFCLPLNDFQMAAGNQLKQLDTYYTPVDERVFLDNSKSLEEQTVLMSDTFSMILGLMDSAKAVEKMNQEELDQFILKHLYAQQGNQQRQSLFQRGLFLAACNEDIFQAFQNHELSLLSLRLHLLYTNERLRAAFVRKNFPSLFRLLPLNCSFQFYAPPLDTIPLNNDLDDIYFQLCNHHITLCKIHDLNPCYTPHPGLAFSLSTSLALGAEHLRDSAIPISRGVAYLTYHSVGSVCADWLKQFIQSQIGYLHRTYQLNLSKHWSRICLAVGVHDLSPQHSIDLYRYSLKNCSEEEYIIWLVEPLIELTRFRLFLGYVLPTIGSLEGFYGNMTVKSKPQWPRLEDDLGQADLNPPENFFEEQELKPLSELSIPSTRDELLQYADELLPPCIAKLIRECTGRNHLRWAARLKVSAFIRLSGFSQAQAFQLWWLIFSETDVAAESQGMRDFLESSQGNVIYQDYKKGKTNDVGISCAAMMNIGLCPFQKNVPRSGDVLVDIENCQVACQDCFTTQNPSKLQMPYRVSSPRGYFNTARRIFNIPDLVFEAKDPLEQVVFIPDIMTCLDPSPVEN